MFLYNPIGKTLAEVHKDCGGNIHGYSVFVLQGEYDTIGKPLDEDFSIGLILKSTHNMRIVRSNMKMIFMAQLYCEQRKAVRSDG